MPALVRERVRALIAPLLSDARVVKVGHDLKHAGMLLARAGAPLEGPAADVLLEPICAARSEYNHLSVRAACAVALDRLLGTR